MAHYFLGISLDRRAHVCGHDVFFYFNSILRRREPAYLAVPDGAGKRTNLHLCHVTNLSNFADETGCGGLFLR